MTTRVSPLPLKRLRSCFFAAGPGFFLGSMAYTRLNGLDDTDFAPICPIAIANECAFFAAAGKKGPRRPLDV
jgi:hypothetical protein